MEIEKIYIDKNGTNKTNKTNEIKKDNKNYHKKFVEKNKDKINEKKVCEICYGNYTYFNKSHHFKSDRHLNAVKIIEKCSVEYL